MLASTHLLPTPGHGRSAFADAPKLPPVSRPRHLAVNNSASISAPLAPINEEASARSHKGIDKIKAITSGESFALYECRCRQSLNTFHMMVSSSRPAKSAEWGNAVTSNML